MKYLYLTLFTCISFSAFAADVGLNASSLKLKAYKFEVSKSKYCTDLKTIVNNGSSAEEVDFLNIPSIGKGEISDGTYPCVVIEMSSHIKFSPEVSSDIGNCQAGTEYTLDVCRSGDSSKLINGDTVDCDSAAGKVALYLSTTGGDGEDAFRRPSENIPERGMNLASALKVTGDSVGIF